MARVFVDLTGTALGAGATFIAGTAGNGGADGIGASNGQARDATVSEDSDRFGAVVHTDQSGTLYIDGAYTRTAPNWRQLGSVAVTAGVPADLDVPVRFPLLRTRFVNGATATTAAATAIHSSFRR
jgi:hypothetical protein